MREITCKSCGRKTTYNNCGFCKDCVKRYGINELCGSKPMAHKGAFRKFPNRKKPVYHCRVCGKNENYKGTNFCINHAIEYGMIEITIPTPTGGIIRPPTHKPIPANSYYYDLYYYEHGNTEKRKSIDTEKLIIAFANYRLTEKSGSFIHKESIVTELNNWLIKHNQKQISPNKFTAALKKAIPACYPYRKLIDGKQRQVYMNIAVKLEK